MLDFREARVVFTPNARVQVKQVAVDFGRVVNRGSVALQEFNMGYADDLDRDMARMVVNLDGVDTEGSEVRFRVSTLFRDASNNDPFNAEVRVLVLAELADVT